MFEIAYKPAKLKCDEVGENEVFSDKELALINQGLQEVKDGRTKEYTLAELKKLMGL
ncbi:MAG: hypothetical protein LBQ31_05510 [Bacteroidales bacterium]|jgi:hypothetical protein|nr:hypothetical protein [Bacteroidales bacterium]